MLSRSEESHNRQLPFPAGRIPKHLQHINQYAAGIDIGSRSDFAVVPEGVDEQPVREFSTFTDNLDRLWRHDGRDGVLLDSRF